jgi:fumarate hydratase class II
MAISTILLDLAATISNAALTITRHNLEASIPAPTFVAKPYANGNDSEKYLTRKDENGEKTTSHESLEVAAASLIQASTDLQILVSGPENYLKGLSYGVCLYCQYSSTPVS